MAGRRFFNCDGHLKSHECFDRVAACVGHCSLGGGSVVSRAAHVNAAMLDLFGAAPSTETSLLVSAHSLPAQGRQRKLRFYLERVTGGLYVEREEIPDQRSEERRVGKEC